MSCPLTKTLRITFTPPTTAPDNGYRIKWRVVGDTAYTTAVGPFTSSPATLSNIPACSSVEGTVEAVCGATYSNVASFTVPAGYTSVTCAGNLTGSQATTTSYTYPDKLIDLNGSADSISIGWTVNDVPNRFTIYNSNKEPIATSNWVGTSSSSGPWGNTGLSTSSTGTITFNKSTSSGDSRWYYLRVETVGHPTISDSWTATISCSGTTTTTTTVGSTTTIGTGYDFYYATKNSCPTCTYIGSSLVVAFPAGSQVVNGKFYYKDSNTYMITSSTTYVASPAVIFSAGGAGFDTCTAACAASSTTTVSGTTTVGTGYFYVTRLTCPGCGSPASSLVAYFPPTVSVVTGGYYYKDGYAYMVGSSTSAVITPDVTFATGATSYASCTLACNSTTTTTTVAATTTTAIINVDFSLQLDPSNTGSMDIYTKAAGASSYTLSSTLTTNLETFSVNLHVGDSYYVTVTQTARATSSQRAQIEDRLNSTSTYYTSQTSGLPNSVTSTARTIAGGNTYTVKGICGDVV